jgi:hypothetical protein
MAFLGVLIGKMGFFGLFDPENSRFGLFLRLFECF